MHKNKSQLKIISLLFSVTALSTLVACSGDDDDNSIATWSSTASVFSSPLIFDSQAEFGSNGDIMLTWYSQQTEVRDDAEKNTAHTFPGSVPQADAHTDLHTHKDLFRKSQFHLKRYDASSGRWEADTVLRETTYWQKVKTGELAAEDVGKSNENDLIVYNDNVNAAFSGATSIAFNASGDAVATWQQLAEKITKDENNADVNSGDASSEITLFVARYNASTKIWGGVTAIANGNNFVQNSVSISIDNDRNARVIWLGRDENTNIASVYSNEYSNNTDLWAAATLISDGVNSVRSQSLHNVGDGTAVVLWRQYNANASSGTQINLYASWFNTTGWNVTPVLVSNADGDVDNVSVATNISGKLWVSWEQNDLQVDSVNEIWVNQFTGDIATDLINGSWSASESRVVDDTSTDINESLLNMSSPSIAVDVNGNVMLTWVETNGDKNLIRANVFKIAENTWGASSFLISDNSNKQFKSILKTIPNNHVAAKVVASDASRFTVAWQHWDTSHSQSGYKLFSLDYNLSSSLMSKPVLVTKSASLSIEQMQLVSRNRQVSLYWSDAGAEEIQLNKSTK